MCECTEYCTGTMDDLTVSRIPAINEHTLRHEKNKPSQQLILYSIKSGAPLKSTKLPIYSSYCMYSVHMEPIFLAKYYSILLYACMYVCMYICVVD